MTTYREIIIERYRFPRHRTPITNADAQGEVLNDLCGDDLTLYLKLDGKREKIAEAGFSADACALTVVASDILCDKLNGKTPDEVSRITAEQLLAWYGEIPSPSRLKCVLLPLEALHKAMRGL